MHIYGVCEVRVNQLAVDSSIGEFLQPDELQLQNIVDPLKEFGFSGVVTRLRHDCTLLTPAYAHTNSQILLWGFPFFGIGVFSSR